MKKRLTIIVVVIILIATTLSLFACLSKVEIPQGIDLSIMSFNIRQDTSTDGGTHAWSYRREYLVEHIKEQNPSILGMQEVKSNQYAYIKEALASTHEVIWYSRTVDNSQEGLAIAFDKSKFELVSRDMFWLSETPDEESKGFGALFLRICVHAVLKEIETQREISVYCVHLEVLGEKARNKEIELVLSRIEEEGKDTIVLGDFNTDEDSDCYKTTSQKLSSTQKTALEKEEGITYQDFGGNYLTFSKSIDFIFASDAFFAKKFDILQETKKVDDKDVYYSDHFAIRADLIFKS